MNEPAFVHDRGGPYPQMWSGVSVRDYFAAKAMQAYLTNFESAQMLPRALVRNSYEMADAMLAAREAS